MNETLIVMKRKSLIIMCIASYVLMAYPLQSQEKSYTLEELLELSEKHYPRTDAADLYTAISRTDEAIVNAGLGPVVNFNARASWQSDVTTIDLEFPPQLPITSEDLGVPTPPQDMYNVKLDIYQPIYQGGASQMKKKAVKLEHDISQNSLDAEISMRKKQVASLFFNVRQLSLSADISEAYADDLNARLKIVESGVRNGMILAAEADILRAEVTRVKQQLTELRAAEHKARSSLAILTGQPELADASLQDMPIILDTALTMQRAELRVFDLNMEKLANAAELIDTYKKPELSGFGQLGYGRPGLNMFEEDFATYALVGVQLNWLLWDNKSRRKKQEILRINKEVIGLERSAFEQNLQLSLKASMEDLRKVEELIISDKEAIEIRERVTTAYASRLDNGDITAAEYIRQANEEVRARLQLESHRVALQKIKADIRFILGQW